MTCVLLNLRPAAASIVLSIALIAFPAGPLRSARASNAHRIALHSLFAQGDSNGDDTEVAPEDVEKYVAVYKAMQRDRTLTAEQAAAQQGLTLQAFRQLESRVERDDAALQRARDELQASAVQASPASRASSTPGQK